jgi:acyl-CoA synthetase (AMP-forming)/AMP-acid ligase II
VSRKNVATLIQIPIVQVDGLTGKSLTYRSLNDLTRRFGSALAKEGFGRGDVLAVHLFNCPHYMTAVLGAVGR